MEFILFWYLFPITELTYIFFSKLRIYWQYSRGGQSHLRKTGKFGATLTTKKYEFYLNLVMSLYLFGQKLSHVVKEVIIKLHFSAIAGDQMEFY